MRGLFWLFFLLPIFGIGQNIHFIKSYGNSGYDYGRDIKQTPDTGYIATGSSSSFTSGNADAFLLKVDSLGNFEWSYNYGGSNSDWGMELVITHDSSYAIAGYTNSFGAGGFDFYAVRANQFGEPIWEKTYGGSDWDKAYGIAQVNQDSGFVIVGETFSFGNGNRDIYIVRVDQNGDTIWTKTYGGLEDDWASGVLIDGDSIVVCGGTESFGAGMSDGIILKMDLDGNLGWAYTAGKMEEDYFTKVCKFSSSYYLSGTRDYHNGIYLNDFWIYRIADEGIVIEVDTTILNASHEVEIAHDLVVAQLGNIYFAGQTKSFGYSTIDFQPDAFLGKLLTNYYTEFTYRQNFGEEGTDIAWGIDKCYDEGIIACGDLAFNSTGGNNMFIIKLNLTASFPTDENDYDITGPINNSITLSIEDKPDQSNNFVFYPNPVSDFLFINSNGINIEAINIYDASGKLVSTETNFQEKIDFSDFIPGVYFLNVISESKNYTFKILKT